MSQSVSQRAKKRPTNFEMANQMFKDAFIIKKMRFSHLHPGLSEQDLHQMTIDYFRNLPDDEGRKGKL